RDFHVTGVQTCALPIFFVSPSSVISKITSPVSAFFATVPRGTSIISSLPSAPVRSAEPPGVPASAITCLRYLRCSKVQCCDDPFRITCPPRPPSPPSGPSFAVNLSRCKCADPAPPRPERQHILT